MNINDISKVFTSQLRLAIISSLLSQDLLFSELKEITGSTDGNLSVQLKKLSEWGFVESKKVISSNKFLTTYRLTEKGGVEFEKYVLLLESVLGKKDDVTK